MLPSCFIRNLSLTNILWRDVPQTKGMELYGRTPALPTEGPGVQYLPYLAKTSQREDTESHWQETLERP